MYKRCEPFTSRPAPSLFLLFDGLCLVNPASMMTVCDMATGETIDLSVGEFSAPTTSAGESHAVRLRAHISISPSQAEHVAGGKAPREVVMAALVGEGPLWLRVDQTTRGEWQFGTNLVALDRTLRRASIDRRSSTQEG